MIYQRYTFHSVIKLIADEGGQIDDETFSLVLSQKPLVSVTCEVSDKGTAFRLKAESRDRQREMGAFANEQYKQQCEGL